jgi:hypothetical protein
MIMLCRVLARLVNTAQIRKIADTHDAHLTARRSAGAPKRTLMKKLDAEAQARRA